MRELEKKVNFSPAFDKRSSDPNKNYGIGAVRITFILGKGDEWVQFMIGTDWYPPHIQQDPSHHVSVSRKFGGIEPTGWDVGYHSPRPMYDGHTKMDNCSLMPSGCGCYYDGSSLRAEEWVPVLLSEGSDGIWKLLEDEWVFRFGERK